MEERQDYFISHASADKEPYVQPLAERLAVRGVTFWLDSREIGWGDTLAMKINQGLRESRHFVICLSSSFLDRPWPEAELSAAFNTKMGAASKKVLPLILNSKESVLKEYPLLASLAYREYNGDPDKIAIELASLVERRAPPPDHLHLVIESVHTGRISNLSVAPRVSIKWLAEQARTGAGLKDTLETGGFDPYRIRWVLVDSRAETEWRSMSRWQKRDLHAMIKTPTGEVIRVEQEHARIQDIGVSNDTVFHLYAVEDEYQGHVCYSMPGPGGD